VQRAYVSYLMGRPRTGLGVVAVTRWWVGLFLRAAPSSPSATARSAITNCVVGLRWALQCHWRGQDAATATGTEIDQPRRFACGGRPLGMRGPMRLPRRRPCSKLAARGRPRRAAWCFRGERPVGSVTWLPVAGLPGGEWHWFRGGDSGRELSPEAALQALARSWSEQKS
jgi:hypothetical protein